MAQKPEETKNLEQMDEELKGKKNNMEK